VSAKVAVAVSHRRDCAFPKDVTTKDIALRRKVEQHALRQLNAKKLRELAAAKEHPFPDLVDEELGNRRTSHAPVYIDKTSAPPMAQIGRHGLTMLNKDHSISMLNGNQFSQHRLIAGAP